MNSELILNPLNFTQDGYVDYNSIPTDNLLHFPPFKWEIIDWKYFTSFYGQNPDIALIISFLYILAIFGMQFLMRKRSAFVLKKELFLWNATLGIFSIVGLIRTLPGYWIRFNQPQGFYRTLCIRETSMNPQLAYWSHMFVASKVVELGDTFFIVLRKKPLQFLQWFHHAVSLNLAWNTVPYLEPILTYYGLMNFGVHGIMYSYFALKAIDVRVPRPVANLITTMQFLQMIFGVYINCYTSYFYYFKNSCDRDQYTIKLFILAYGSFFFLFGKLFVRLVIKSPRIIKKIN